MLGKDVMFCYGIIFVLTSKSRPTLGLKAGFISCWGTRKDMKGGRDLTSINVKHQIFLRF